MADSVDRVFVHALNTVKRVPRAGATRPPAADRMRLYGLYKQAMEGDVDGVMERPGSKGAAELAPEELAREQDKWDYWYLQKGLGRTEAKRRYIETLIETMRKYATTPNAADLVGELEFVWNQVKMNSATAAGGSSSTDSSPEAAARHFRQPQSGTDVPLRLLSPMSEEDASETRIREDDEAADDGHWVKKGGRWSKKMERAVFRLSSEIAALREQITTGREWRGRKQRTLGAWAGWFLWTITKHITVDIVILGIVLIWLRRRKDGRIEDHIRGALRVAREYMRIILPTR